MASFTQSFIKGMNTDTDISSLPQGSYRLAKNLTFTTIENGTSGALENVKGNVLLNNMNSIFGAADNEIVGYINIIDDIVFFTYQATTGYSSIWVYTHSTNTTTLFYTDKCTTDGSTLNFSTDPERRIVGVGRYENEKIRKIYWTDGTEEVRYANLEKVYLENPESAAICGTNDYLPVSSFSLLPNISLGNIWVNSLSVLNGGALTAGSVQYAYKLYYKNGAESLMSSASRIVRLTSNIPSQSGTFTGNDIDEKVNKSVKVNLSDIDTSFDYIKVYRIFYKSLKDLPTISMIYEGEIVDSSFYVIDSGNSILEIPFEEYISLGSRLFTAKALASKNNHLFAANIKEEYFDANIDCRAYRFITSNTQTVEFQVESHIHVTNNYTCIAGWDITSGDLTNVDCTIDSNGNVYIKGKGTYEIEAHVLIENRGSTTGTVNSKIQVITPNATFDSYSPTESLDGGDAVTCHTGAITFAHDGVSRKVWVCGKDLDNRGFMYFGVENQSFVQMLTIKFTPETISKITDSEGSAIEIKSDGSWSYTSGGSGSGTDWSIPETYDCINPVNDIFNNNYSASDAVNGFLYSTAGDIGGTGKVVSYKIENTWGSMIGEKDSASCSKDVLIDSTFKINEVYRFGIVFYDKKGRQSFVNWVGDILIPRYNSSGISWLNPVYGSVWSNSRHIVFTLNLNNVTPEIRSEIKGFKIVYVERKTSDMTVAAQGFINNVERGITGISTELHPKVILYGETSDHAMGDYFCLFYSPDVTIGELKEFPNNSKANITSIYNASGLDSREITIDSTHKMYTVYTTDSDEAPHFNTITMLESYSLDFVEEGISGVPFYEKAEHNGSLMFSRNSTLINRPRNDSTSHSTSQENYGPTSSLLTFSDVIYLDPGDKENELLSIYLLDIINDNDSSRYGGNRYENRANNIYISGSYYTSISSTATSVEIISYGDTFISVYEQMVAMYDNNITGDYGKQSLWMFPVESKVNYNFATTKPSQYMKHRSYGPPGMGIMEEQVEGIARFPDKYPDNLGDLYNYNPAYSVPAFGLYPTYTSKPLLFEADETNHVAIVASEEKTNGETIDNWTKFLYANILEVDTAYGGVNELVSLDNKLFFWQDTAFGIVAVNDRSLITDQSGAQLSLGSGGVLERYDYYSNNVGLLEKYNVTNSENALFWVFTPLEKIYIFDNQIKELSTISSVNSYLHNKTPIINPISVVDYTNHETLFKINDEVLVYSWLSNSFTGVYTFDPSWLVKIYNGNYASVPTADNHTLWEHNDTTVNRANFYGSDNESYIYFIVNKDYRYTKVFDTIDWFSTSLGDSSVEDNKQVNNYDDTFSQLRAYTDYQNTDWIILYADPDSTSQNVTRRERSFVMQMPRDKVNKPQKDNVDIFDSGDWDKSVKYKQRMRDKFLHIEMKYNNSLGNKFFFPYVNVNYRQSIR